eukprot:4745135-Amphidinium_carterae.1
MPSRLLLLSFHAIPNLPHPLDSWRKREVAYSSYTFRSTGIQRDEDVIFAALLECASHSHSTCAFVALSCVIFVGKSWPSCSEQPMETLEFMLLCAP